MNYDATKKSSKMVIDLNDPAGIAGLVLLLRSTIARSRRGGREQ